MRVVRIFKAGCISYGVGERLQQILANRHHENTHSVKNTLLILQYKPVYTVGIRSNQYTDEEEVKLRNLGAEFWKTNRGGLITFHGPGQLVAYPVLNLKHFKPSIKWYVQQLENAVIRTCSNFNITAHTSPHTGVWIGDNKICSIGVHSKRYITTHGLALNCNNDLRWFDHIVPCGIKDKGVTSISEELAFENDVDSVTPIFIKAFAAQFQCMVVNYSHDETSYLLWEASNYLQ